MRPTRRSTPRKTRRAQPGNCNLAAANTCRVAAKRAAQKPLTQRAQRTVIVARARRTHRHRAGLAPNGECVAHYALTPNYRSDKRSGQSTTPDGASGTPAVRRTGLPSRVPAVGFEPTRSCLQWILSPPFDLSGKLASMWLCKPCGHLCNVKSTKKAQALH